ncbi:ABC transporter substrate-binding protein [Bacterioplanes sanyensis]|uniref:ABC transporter substrate-binding protein n=1 Tax=Bacterioplanes sanyensis TaxID=1249553 RepID=A0A222FHW5_9GAMM|nr:glycine betaine ABC transporter substrate-binding protein [Bacterioplanes sanyensis]ASP38350.1 ABC transporter substrate-binding protein [Bacterioplanes sanyensis]
MKQVARSVLVLTAIGYLSGCSDSSSTAETTADAGCGSVTIADMNWDSASFLAHLDAAILSMGYDCDVQLVPGDSQPTTASMVSKSEPDIAPEMWTNSNRELIQQGVDEGRLAFAGRSLSDGGQEGFWVPAYMLEQYPQLATIDGIRQHAELFTHPEDPEASAFYGCPAGWTCQLTTERLFNAMELDSDGFKIVNPGSGTALAGSLARAYEQQAPWFGYYWAPTALLGQYEMAMVDFGSGIKAEHFRQCITQTECAEPQVTMYPPSDVYTVTTASFAQRAPEAMAYLNRRGFSNQHMNRWLAWMQAQQADGEFAALTFLQQEGATWKTWVSEDVANKIEQQL